MQMQMRVQVRVLVLVLSLVVSADLGCSARSDALDDARKAWLASTLVDDNFDLLQRDKEAVREKFAKMAATPYSFFRGTIGQYLRDLKTARIMGSFGIESPGASEIMIIGDPHMENVGSFRRTDGLMVLNFNDFDGARYGPWHVDLRRLALSFVAFEKEPSSIDEAERLGRVAAEAYALELDELKAGTAPSPILRGSRGGVFVEDLFRRAQRDGSKRAELETYVDGGAEGEKLWRGEVEGRTDPAYREDELVELTPDERENLKHLFFDYRSPAGFEPPVAGLDIVRQLGQGVSSYANLRYLVLISLASGEKHLLELKEERALEPLEIASFPTRAFDSNGERSIAIEERMQSATDDDAWLGYAAENNGFSFRVREASGYQKGLRVKKIEELLGDGTASADDLVALAATFGRLLADSHARGRTLDGRPALEALPKLEPISLADEISSFIKTYGPRFLLDYDLYQELREEKGTLLGYEDAYGNG